jgi:hypothetical protein
MKLLDKIKFWKEKRHQKEIELAKLKGELKLITKQLLEEFDVSNIKEAESKSQEYADMLQDLDGKIKSLKQKVEEMVEGL